MQIKFLLRARVAARAGDGNPIQGVRVAGFVALSSHREMVMAQPKSRAWLALVPALLAPAAASAQRAGRRADAPDEVPSQIPLPS
jgi:hypothetical protein